MVERERNTAALLKTEALTRRQSLKGQWSVNRTTHAQNQVVQRSEHLKAAFAKISAATGAASRSFDYTSDFNLYVCLNVILMMIVGF